MSSIEILAPWPPPVTVKKSEVAYKLPSFVIVFLPGIPVIFALIKNSSVSLAVPDISSPIWKVPTIVSSFKINSVTVVEPIRNFLVVSTIGVAPDVAPIICLPI